MIKALSETEAIRPGSERSRLENVLTISHARISRTKSTAQTIASVKRRSIIPPRSKYSQLNM